MSKEHQGQHPEKCQACSLARFAVNFVVDIAIQIDQDEGSADADAIIRWVKASDLVGKIVHGA